MHAPRCLSNVVRMGQDDDCGGHKIPRNMCVSDVVNTDKDLKQLCRIESNRGPVACVAVINHAHQDTIGLPSQGDPLIGDTK